MQYCIRTLLTIMANAMSNMLLSIRRHDQDNDGGLDFCTRVIEACSRINQKSDD